MRENIVIQKNPTLADSQHYELLRSKGLEYIQQLGSRLWTDYNIHDPGITLLELLCYAISDLGNRSMFDIKDLLAEPEFAGPPEMKEEREKQARERQGFFSARDILTVNPWTIDDFRKMLIDIEGVKNAWLYCKQCPCDDLYLYANCKTGALQYEWSDHPVVIKGFYDVLIECEDDESAGNLNSGTVNYNFSFMAGDELANAVLEMRLPSWQVLQANSAAYEILGSPDTLIKQVEVPIISGNKEDDADIQTSLGNALRRPLFATMKITYKTGETGKNKVLTFTDVPFRIWFISDTHRRAVQLNTIREAMTDASTGGIMGKYMAKIKRLKQVMQVTSHELHSHRNLCEDYCSIRAIETEDFAVCADLEVESYADIEAIMAEAFYQIDQYMRPDIKFYSLQQMLASGKSIDQIFEGPPLQNGFIDGAQISSTGLRTILYTSDIVNLIMDILGVKAVRNVTLARYDDEGNVVDNNPWSLEVGYQRQPGLYIAGSKFLVFKDGLPFLPDRFELNDTMQVIRGRNAQPKFSITETDITIPKGSRYDLTAYYPLQYSLPLTYGVGYDGLPESATPQRKAQAKQLKAYLLLYEQLLVNYLEQLAHVKELFALDDTVDKTYFTKLIAKSDIIGIEDLYNGLTAGTLQALSENDTLMLDRRNRFLDHLLARFAEQFTDYALMLFAHIDNSTIAGDKLIKNKIDFLKDYPFISANRGRSFNYKDTGAVCSSDNISGLQKRLQRLLGFRQLMNYYLLQENKDANGNIISRQWVIINQQGKKLLKAPEVNINPSLLACINQAEVEIAALQQHITDNAAYQVVKEDGRFVIQVKDAQRHLLAISYRSYATNTGAATDDANTATAEIQAFVAAVAAAEKIQVVEHVLLRPREVAPMFELYEESDVDGKLYERRWRLVETEKGKRKIHLSASTRYYADKDLELSERYAQQEIAQVVKYIFKEEHYKIFDAGANKDDKKQWYMNLVDKDGEVIATRKQLFKTKKEAEKARDEIMAFAKKASDERYPLLPICIPPGCPDCGEEDPYSFRMTVVLNGEMGMVNSNIVFRRFAEKTIREEIPAHLGVKVCWVSIKQFNDFEKAYCSWLGELAKETSDADTLKDKFRLLLNEFSVLKNVYPKATLHDCVDGNDENRVLLGQTAVVDAKKLHNHNKETNT